MDVVQETCAGKNREKPIGFPMVSPWFPIAKPSQRPVLLRCPEVVGVASSPPHGYLRWDDGVKSPSQCFEKSPKKINKHRTYRERERERLL